MNTYADVIKPRIRMKQNMSYGKRAVQEKNEVRFTDNQCSHPEYDYAGPQ